MFQKEASTPFPRIARILIFEKKALWENCISGDCTNDSTNVEFPQYHVHRNRDFPTTDFNNKFSLYYQKWKKTSEFCNF